jgi:hypothetical protein
MKSTSSYNHILETKDRARLERHSLFISKAIRVEAEYTHISMACQQVGEDNSQSD